MRIQLGPLPEEEKEQVPQILVKESPTARVSLYSKQTSQASIWMSWCP